MFTTDSSIFLRVVDKGSSSRLAGGDMYLLGAVFVLVKVASIFRFAAPSWFSSKEFRTESRSDNALVPRFPGDSADSASSTFLRVAESGSSTRCLLLRKVRPTDETNGT